MDHGGPIEFTLFAVNGAGNGKISEPFWFKKVSGLCTSAIYYATLAAYFCLYCIFLCVSTNGHEVLSIFSICPNWSQRCVHLVFIIVAVHIIVLGFYIDKWCLMCI